MVENTPLLIMDIRAVIFHPYFGTVFTTHPVNIRLFIAGVQNVAASFFGRKVKFIPDFYIQHFLFIRITEHPDHGRIDIHKLAGVCTAVDTIQHTIEQGTETFLGIAQCFLNLLPLDGQRHLCGSGCQEVHIVFRVAVQVFIVLHRDHPDRSTCRS